MTPRTASALLALLALGACSGARWPAASPAPPVKPQDWPVYGGSAAADRYSPLEQINRANVARLEPAWRFEEHEDGDPETNPLIIGRTLYAYTPTLKVIALDAANGTLRWTFDPGVRGSGPHRGLAYWREGTEQRLLAGSMNFLYALDPETGAPIPSFGRNGRVDLMEGLRDDAAHQYVSLTSPGIVYQDLVIVGFRTGESEPSPPGDIRAYDVRSGALRWTFHTIPHPNESGYDTWPKDAWRKTGAANDWAGFALDERRGIVYAPTGSAVFDFYGGDRVGDDLYANTLLALDAATGKRVWHFQTTHHDLWDRDLPSQPSLLTLIRDGKRIDAIAQTTKQGYVFVFDRATGVPLFPIAEVPYPRSEVAGEVSARTQPRPLLPAPFARQTLTESDLTLRTPAAHAWAVARFRTFRSDGLFVPLGIESPTVVFPGFDGGAEWGGAAVDPATAVMYVNANEIAWTGALVKRRPGAGLGQAIYESRCSGCHGLDRRGSPPQFPSLLDAATRLTDARLTDVIHTGGGRMPPFPTLRAPALDDLLYYVRTGTQRPLPAGEVSKEPLTPMDDALIDADDGLGPYLFTGYDKFLDPDGYPAIAPPWGTLNAIDLNSGRTLWRIPLGQYPELVHPGSPDTGSENYGGPIVTGGGLVFIGATVYDSKLRAFDSSTGALLWEHSLPYAGTATPATYMIDGRQYVVIATSNARNRKAPQGAAYAAFALPDSRSDR